MISAIASRTVESAPKGRRDAPFPGRKSSHKRERQSLYEEFNELGICVEWHDFVTDREREFDWSKTFRPDCVEICLNVEGYSQIWAEDRELSLSPATVGYYVQAEPGLRAVRRSGERHQFMTIEFSRSFLKNHIACAERGLHPMVSSLFTEGGLRAMGVSDPVRLTTEHQQIIRSLLHPPVCQSARGLWYRAKALEVAAALLYEPLPEEMHGCDRRKALNQERVQKVIAILKANLSEPISLEEIAQRSGCSRFYLCRIFLEEMGVSICKYWRGLRMERAAALLREGKLNVTEVAFEVGYSNPSHFSTAFRETFGCCPGLYPLPIVSCPKHGEAV